MDTQQAQAKKRLPPGEARETCRPFYPEIADLRNARETWPNIRDKLGAKHPKLAKLTVQQLTTGTHQLNDEGLQPPIFFDGKGHGFESPKKNRKSGGNGTPDPLDGFLLDFEDGEVEDDKTEGGKPGEDIMGDSTDTAPKPDKELLSRLSRAENKLAYLRSRLDTYEMLVAGGHLTPEGSAILLAEIAEAAR